MILESAATEDASGPAYNATVFTALLQRHAEWVGAVRRVGNASTDARERMTVAASALAELEVLAPRAGLLLADALAGHAPEAAAELLDLLRALLPVAHLQEPEGVVAVDETAPVADTAIVELLPEVLAPPPALGVTTVSPPPKPPSPPVPVTPAAVALLKASLNGELKSAPLHGTAKIEHNALDSLRKLLGGVPPALKLRAQILGQLRQVELTVAETRNWEQLNRVGRRIMVESVAARIRAIQDAAAGISEMQYVDDVKERTARLMRELRKQTADGRMDRAAWGLALKHEARGESWLDDARQLQGELEEELGIAPAPPPLAKFNVDDAFRRLREEVLSLPPELLTARILELLANGVSETDKRFVKVLEPRLPELAQDRAWAKLTRAVAGALAEGDEPGDVRQPIEANWRGFAFTEGRSAVIVGGDGRAERSVVLQGAFRFSALDWPDIPKNSPGKANALVGQVRKGKYQIVICLQPFISHKLTDQLFDLNVPGTKVVLAQGYGALQIKLALDRYLPRPARQLLAAS